MSMKRITTLVKSAASYDLVTLETVKVELEIPDSDTSKDAWLTGVIHQISGSCARYCNRSAMDVNEASFPVETVQDLFFPERDAYPYQVPGGTDPLQLSHWPLASLTDSNGQPLSAVTSVVIADPPGTNTVLVEGTDFIVNPAFGQLVRLDPWSQYPTLWLPIKTTVIYAGGFNLIPDDVQEAALRWITQRYKERGRDPNLRAKEEPNLGRMEYWTGGPPMSGGVPEEIAELLWNYRSPVCA